MRALLAHLTQCKSIFNSTTTFLLVLAVSTSFNLHLFLLSPTFLSLHEKMQEKPQKLHLTNSTSPPQPPIAKTVTLFKAGSKITRNQIKHSDFLPLPISHNKIKLAKTNQDLMGAKFPSKEGNILWPPHSHSPINTLSSGIEMRRRKKCFLPWEDVILWTLT